MKFDEKKILERLGKQGYRELTFDELCLNFQVPQKERKQFRRMLKFLRRDFKIIRTHDKRYRLVDERDFIVGTIKKHSEGFGFLIPDDPSEEDLYLNRFQLMNVMDKDRLKVLKRESIGLKTGRLRHTGKVIQILERGIKKVVGKIFVKGQTAFVIPQKSGSVFGAWDNILIPYSKKLLSLQDQIVVCAIKKYPSRYQHAQGEIVEVLGKMGNVDVDFSVMIHQYDLRHKFPLPVLKEAERVKSWSLKEEVDRRCDLRDLSFMTIDGETAKDFDDAVCVKKLQGSYKLWVAIADVSFFVKEASELDKEAFERATSIYFPGGVIPMLPEILSNDLCSLNPLEEKMTFCCEIEFDEKGNRLSFSIAESVIRSRHRMTYTDIQAILDKNEEVCRKYSSIVSDISIMNELKEILRKARLVRGCLDFDLPEPELILNVQGSLETIVKRPRLDAHMLIEEFMIAANETVSEFMFGRKRPFMYRVHEEPDEETITQFNTLAHNLGFPLKHQKKVHPKVYSELLEKVKDKPAEKVLNAALLRSMKQAVYSEKNIGHFGLASNCYTHFTSPIRRYPDLIVHRLLKAELKKKTKPSDTIDAELESVLQKKAAHCSKQERIAEEAEREFVALKKAQFMMDKVGQEFVGYISGVTEFGFFVELEQYFIEGLVPLKNMKDDFYQFVAQHYFIKGRRSHRTFRLGQRILVNVARVDLDKRQIDFALAGS